MDELRAKHIMADALQVLIRKNRDYGSLNISKTGIQGVATRLLDKASRLVNLTKTAAAVPNYEPLADTFVDIINYGVIGLMLNEGSWDGNAFPDIGYVTEFDTGRMVYLAGPIDDVSTPAAKQWRRLATMHLTTQGISTFDPTQPYGLPTNASPSKAAIIGINKAAIAYSDVVLVNLSGPGKAIGTVREIEFARTLNKRVIVVGHALENHVAAYDLETFGSLEAAILAIVFNPEARAGVQEATGD